MTPGQAGVALSRRIEDETQRAAFFALGEQLLADSDCDLVTGRGLYLPHRRQGRLAWRISAQDALALARNLARHSRTGANRPRPPATLYRDLGPIERPCAIWCAAMWRAC